MYNCKLYVFTPDELKIIQCRSDNPASFVVETSDLSDEIVSNFVFMRIEWYDGDTRHCATVSVSSYDGKKLVLSPSSDIRAHNGEHYHLIDVSEPVEILKITEDELMDFRMRADAINSRSRNSLTSQIKQILLDETLTNQVILKMLIQLDTKLDELLSIKLSSDIDIFQKTRLICLSGGGACFIAENAAIGDLFYVQSTKSNTFAGFALIARAVHTISTPKGVICETEFVNIDESTREGLIRIIFERDREKLKRKKVNG